MSNLQTVQDIYAAFGRGDIPAILERLRPDVAWEPALAANGVPWLQHRTGREEVVGFFESLGLLEFRRFEVKNLVESGNQVIVFIALTLVVKASGAVIEEENEIHIWQFDAAGMVERFEHKLDSYNHWRAFHGAA